MCDAIFRVSMFLEYKMLCITVVVQLTFNTESLDLVNSTTSKSAVDGQTESVSDSLRPSTDNRLSDCVTYTPRPGSNPGNIVATKYLAKTSSNENDPRDIVARIYREELQKLASSAKTNGNFAEFVMYERELERLAQCSTLAAESLPPVSSPTPPRRRKDKRHSGSSKRSLPAAINRNTTLQTFSWPVTDTAVIDHPEDLTTRSSQSRILDDNRYMNSTNQSDDITSRSVHSTPDVNCGGINSASSTDTTSPAPVLSVSQQDAVESAVVMKSEEPEVSADAQQLPSSVAGECSPLDLMRTIADSVTAKSHKKSMSADAPRYILPPITAEQLKHCSYLNTDEIVSAVRSTLADYSISQRLFGEAVLGLSQASSLLY